MVELKWQDPPARSGGTGDDYVLVIEALKAVPGRWALINGEWNTAAPPSAFRQQGCEVTVRRNKSREGKKSWSVYARYPVKVAPASAAKLQVEKAIATGSALTPPPAAPGRQVPVRPVNDMGMGKFIADRRARGAVDGPE